MTDYAVSVSLGGIAGTALSGIFNVLDYGAAKDGVTDDSASVQAAVTAAASAGGEVYFPSGTYILDGITGINGMIRLAKDTVLKHKAASDAAYPAANNYMLRSDGDMTIVGGILDGNKDNQTARTSIIGFYGENLSVSGCKIRNTVQEGIRVHNAVTVDIHNNFFYDIGEHGTVLNEDAMAIHIFASNTDLARVHVNDNFFINGAPSAADVAPVAFSMSTAAGRARECVVSGNTIIGFGTSFTGNPQGAIEVYQNCDRIVVADNVIYDAYNRGIRLSDSSDVLVANNIVYVNSSAAVPNGLSVTAMGHDTTTKHNMQVIGNTVACEAGDGAIYVAGGGASNLLDGANVSDNLVVISGGDGIHLQYCGGNILASNNVIKDCTTYGYRISSSSGSIKLSNSVIDSPTAAGVYARDSVTNLDLTIDGLTISNSGDLGISNRAPTLNLMNCVDDGSTRILDTTNTAGYVHGCSWQKVYSDQASGVNVSKNDYGVTFTNQGATGSTTFILPDVTTIPEGFWCKFIVLAAQQMDIDPNAADQIFPTTDAAGDRLRNAGAIGSSVTLEYTHADGWCEVAKVGTWTDAN